MIEIFARVWATVLVLLRAAPTWGAAAVAVLTTVSVEVVPLLPGPWAVRAGAWVAVALAAVRTVLSMIERLTPVPPDLRGIEVPSGVAQASWPLRGGGIMTYIAPSRSGPKTGVSTYRWSAEGVSPTG